MAISPPSDLILDVARAADPAQVRAATDRLARLAADPAATNADFGKAMVAARKAVPWSAAPATQMASAPPAMLNTATVKARAVHDKGSVYQKFEAMILTNFVENMLPKDDELFGDKASAAPYRSMMAEQLATQIAKAGGVGIAKSVERVHPSHAPKVPTVS